MRHAPGFVQRVQQGGGHLGGVDDRGQPGSQLVQCLNQLEAFAEQNRQHLLLHASPQRIEEGQDHEGRAHGVEQKQAGPVLQPVTDHAVDQRQHQGQGGHRRHPSEELVEVEEPVALQRLGQEEQIKRGGHAAQRWPGQPQPRQRIQG